MSKRRLSDISCYLLEVCAGWVLRFVSVGTSKYTRILLCCTAHSLIVKQNYIVNTFEFFKLMPFDSIIDTVVVAKICATNSVRNVRFRFSSICLQIFGRTWYGIFRRKCLLNCCERQDMKFQCLLRLFVCSNMFERSLHSPIIKL